MKDLRRYGLTWLALCVGLGCSPSGNPEAVERFASQGAWVQVGTARDLQEAAPGGALPEQLASRVRSPPPPVTALAVQAWREAPGEDSAHGLAQAYFPRLAGGGEAEPRKLPVSPAAALQVRPAATEEGEVEVAARGYTFKVRPLQGGTASVSKREPGAIFYGARHFWVAAGGAAAEHDGVWLAPRVDELMVVEGSGAPFRASYEVEVPEGIEALREADGYLEFLDGQDVPVVRLHSPVARDSAGHSRQGEVRLQGVTFVGRSGLGDLTRLALEGRTLKVEMEVELRGLVGPTLVNPTWSSTGATAVSRLYAASALLPDGKVLIAGGQDYYNGYASAEVYDPATGSWSATGSMSIARVFMTATVLPNGKVLAVGGADATVELYDPATGTWSLTTPMPESLFMSSATLLLNGKVLVMGSGNYSTSAYLYDPVTETWTPTEDQVSYHALHTATLLPDGRVLVAGGHQNVSSAELYDPETNSWSATGSMSMSRYLHTATLLPDGRVLVAGGRAGYYEDSSQEAELYDPATGTWSMTGSMNDPHAYHNATLLPDGRVLVTLGEQGYWSAPVSAELYDPAAGTWSMASSPSHGRAAFMATLLPNGRVLVAGGEGGYGGPGTSEVYDPGAERWSAAGSLSTARASAMATLLPDGKALVVGGREGAEAHLAQAELYDVTAGSWSATGSLTEARTGATITLLPNGKVLVAGGRNATGWLASAELYDPAAHTWSTTGTMGSARAHHAAMLLPNGKVLVAGGEDASGTLASAQLYDPAEGTWSAAGAMASARAYATATRLPDGTVLVTGGVGASGPVARAEVFDPVTGTWSLTGALVTARSRHTATVLPGGKVLVIGGAGSTGSALASAEVYNPVTGRWSVTGSLATARLNHTATLLLDGRVVVAGGEAAQTPVTSLEVYDPAKGTFSTRESLATARTLHTATLLPDGRVLVVGGSGLAGSLSSAELYDDSGALEAWRPLVTPPGRVRPGAPFTVSGFGFHGASEASGGGRYSAATNFPLVQLTPAGGGGMSSLSRQDFSDTSVAVNMPAGVDGYYVLTVTTNAIHGGTMLYVDGQAPAAPVLTAPASLVNTATPVIGGTAEAGSTVTVTLDGAVVGTVTASASGAWSFTPASAVAQGEHAVTAAATDEAGNQGASSAVRHFTVDSVAPLAPVFTAPAALVSSVTPTLEGTAEAGSTVTVTLDGAGVGTVTANASGVWSFTPASALSQGAHTATATATDLAGNTSTSSAVRSFMVDTVAPEAPVLTAPAALVNTVTPAIEGRAEPGSTVTVRVDGIVAGTVSANTFGAWSFTPASALAQGIYTAIATATDAAGNTSAPSAPRNFTVDSMAPAKPVLTAPALLINTTTPTIEGTAEAGSTVMVMLDGTAAGIVTASSAGAWSFTPDVPLSQGGHTATATATDAAGNTSALSTARRFTVDNVAPAVPGFAAPAALVNTTTPALRGVAEAGSLVTVTLDGIVVGTVTANALGAWSLTPASSLAQGAHVATATATDAAGNTSAPSAPHSFSVDTAAPAAPVLVPMAAFVNTSTPAIQGTAEPGSTVTVMLDGLFVGTATANATGAWSFTPVAPLEQGAHTATAMATDAVGNTSLVSAARSFTVDTLAPAPPVVTAPGAYVNTTTPIVAGTAEAGSTVVVMLDGVRMGTVTANDVGAWSFTPASPLTQGAHLTYAVAVDAAGNTSWLSSPRSFTVSTVALATPVITAPASLVSTTTPVLAGTAPAGSTVTVTLDGTVVGTVTANALGGWSFTPAVPLAQGAHSAIVTATDAAGNTSAPSAPRSFTVDTVAPAPPQVLAPAANSTVGIDMLTFSGTAEAGSLISVSVDGTLVGTAWASQAGAWSVTSPYVLTLGQHTVAATATDMAGNVSQSSGHSFLMQPVGHGCSSSPTSAVPALCSVLALWLWGRRRSQA